MIAKNSLKTERQKQKLVTEIRIHKSCHNPNIVAFEHNFEDNDNVYILLELCQNQTLSEIHVRRKVFTIRSSMLYNSISESFTIFTFSSYYSS